MLKGGEDIKVITIASRKGGTGKTSTAAAIGAGLKRRGFRVLGVDLDSQKNLTFTAAGAGERSIMDVLRGDCLLSEAIVAGSLFDIVPASEDLAEADTVIRGPGKEYKLQEALQKIQYHYSYCIIDTPAALGILTVNALTAADRVVLPVQADAYSLQGIEQMKEAVEVIHERCNSRLKVSVILATRYNGRSILARDMLENLKEPSDRMNAKLMTVRECVAVKEAGAMQESLFEYAPRCTAARDYDELVIELTKEDMR